MALKNKLNITDSTELARMEEKISKKKALELFENGYLDKYKVGTSSRIVRGSKIRSNHEVKECCDCGR